MVGNLQDRLNNVREEILSEIVEISREVSSERILRKVHAAAKRLIPDGNFIFSVDDNLQVRASTQSILSKQDQDLANMLAQVSSMALINNRSDDLNIRLRLEEERSRIANELHDRVLQRIFATGMSLEGALRKAVVADVINALKQAIVDLDETIGQIRSTVYSLKGTNESLHRQILKEIERARDTWKVVIDFNFAGPIDTLIGQDKYADIIAVTCELLNNAGRHGVSDVIKYNLIVDGDLLELRTINNCDSKKMLKFGNGLENCSARAAKYGGQLQVQYLQPELRILWKIPL